jgi:hypothetical protein
VNLLQLLDIRAALTSARRAYIARESHVPQTKTKHAEAINNELRLAKVLKVPATHHQHVFDIIKGRDAIEVKSMFPGIVGDSITMHPKSLRKKRIEALKQGYRTHTVVFDMRGKQVALYYREGLGSFRLSTMRKVSFPELEALFSTGN